MIHTIVICGLGAVGGNIAKTLLYTQPNMHLILVDDDLVCTRNITAGTQPYTKQDIGRYKTQALHRIFYDITKLSVDIVTERITEIGDIIDIVRDPEHTLLIDAFDNVISRNIFTLLSNDYNVVHIGFSGRLSGNITWECFEPMKPAHSDNNIDVCEMAVAKPFIDSLIGIAVLAITDFIDNDKRTNIYFDKQLHLKILE